MAWPDWVRTVLRVYVVVLAGLGALVVLRALTPSLVADPVRSSVWFTLVGFAVLALAVVALGYTRRE